MKSTLKNRTLASIIAAVALVFGMVVSFASPASASTPVGLATTVFCPDGTSGCTEYRYGFTVPNSSPGQFGIYYTVKWSSGGGSWEVKRIRLVNNSSARVYFNDLGFVYAGHYYRLYLNYGASVAEGASISFTDSALGGLSGTGVGKWVPKNTGAYATANPSDSSTWYMTASLSGITGAFILN